MFAFQPRLTGALMAMRPLQAGDFAGLYAIGGDPLVWALHPQPERATAAGFKAYFDDQLASCGALVAMNRADGATAGCSRFSMLYADPGEVEIGWTFLGRAYWGGKYNFEMKRLMLEHAFNDVPRVIFRIGEHNMRSRRAIEKIGAVLTGRVQHATVGGRTVTHVIYAISKPQFLATSSLNTTKSQ